ncbi:aldehyde dehydrogenase (NAD+) [Desulfuromusa kysingii]|uniref:Aldehyde dehydrogenase (NAD+) n=1 Tax=Desulfuromusa kysingii TaxID=37625 RepID=A0A1H3YBR0_9BACT|nr:aldehyde dehydrogenase family protein [Desulfuromusa kysingii]SEA08989.1 aldehyde dehydrogenase (NAD+) [Desulfuromusa kysingii]
MALNKNYINGEWVESNDVNLDINPSDTNDIIGEYARADEQQTNDAIQAAKAARNVWRDVCVNEKSIILDNIGSEILARKTELATLLAREEGKTLPEATGEVVRAGMIFKFFSGEAVRLTGDILASTRPGLNVEITREPVGVIGVISPWNFPIAIPAWKIAPALAFGNTVVLKSADLVPASAWALAEIISRAGLPAGAFNLVMGSGSKVGDTIVNSPDIDAVTFTGSDAIGNGIRGKVAGRGAKVQLEMGGKNPLVVLDDADLDTAINAAVDGAFFGTGQRCTASSRLIVTEGIHDAFVAGVIERLQGLRTGHALDSKSQIGPVSSQAQLQTDLEYISIGKEEGAHLAYGGELLQRDTPGYYLSPALFTETDNDMRLNREEVFGPVATVIRAKNYEEALELANDTRFGLTSGICTTSLESSKDFKRNSEAGMVMVNLPTAGIDYHVPFGGRKNSSYGSREQGSYAREFFTIVKTCYIG